MAKTESYGGRGGKYLAGRWVYERSSGEREEMCVHEGDVKERFNGRGVAEKY